MAIAQDDYPTLRQQIGKGAETEETKVTAINNLLDAADNEASAILAEIETSDIGSAAIQAAKNNMIIHIMLTSATGKAGMIKAGDLSENYNFVNSNKEGWAKTENGVRANQILQGRLDTRAKTTMFISSEDDTEERDAFSLSRIRGVGYE